MQDKKISSRWATDEEVVANDSIKVVTRDAKESVAGIPVGSNGKNILVDTSSMHTLVIGSTGSGKTQSITLPSINTMINNNESMVVLDAEGEILSTVGTKLEENNYNIITINFNDPKYGNHFNPLSLVEDYYKANEVDKCLNLLQYISNSLFCSDKEKGKDPFWDNTSSDYFQGLVMLALENNMDNITFRNIFELSIRINEFEKTLNDMRNTIRNNVNSKFSTFLSSTLLAPAETRKSIITVFESKFKKYILDDRMNEMMSITDFSFEDIKNKKTSIFIIGNISEKYKSLYSITIEEIYNYISVTNNTNRVNFLLDNFSYYSPILSLTNMLASSRSKNIRFTIILNSFEELYAYYGKETGEILKSEFGIIIYLLSNQIGTLEEISRLCGNVYNKNEQSRLISINELQHFNFFEALILKQRCYPYKTKLIPNYELGWNKDSSYQIKEHNMVNNNCNLFEMIRDKEVNDFIKKPKLDDLINRIDSKIEELEKSEKEKKDINREKEIIVEELKDINLKELSDRKIVIERTTITIYPKQ